MYMYNNPVCPWMPGNFSGDRNMYGNGMPQFQPRHPFPYNMMPPAPSNWQGPGPSRPRGRGYRRGRGASHHGGNFRHQRQNEQDMIKDMCCQCGERLQNSNEPGIHLCDGGSQVILPNPEPKENTVEKTEEEKQEEELDARLEKVLENLKDFVRSKYNSVTEALEGYVSDKISEISTLHKENSEEKKMLEKMKTDLEDKANKLIKQEQEIKEKQKRLSRDQEAFKREMKKEREEVCRQWQQLRDEITRMEEMHKIQKVCYQENVTMVQGIAYKLK